jgi:signal transduction histidine kinase
VAVGLLVLGLLATAVRLDSASDSTILRLGWSTWRADAIVVDVPGRRTEAGLRTGDVVTAIAGHRFGDGLGRVAAPDPGAWLTYEVDRSGPTLLPVTVDRPTLYPLLNAGWGDLVFVVTLAVLAVVLYLRRPEEPATTPLLVNAAALLGSTLVVVAGLPVLAVAVGGPQLWLFELNTVVAYSVGWGAILAFSLTIVPGHPWLDARRRNLIAAYVTPVTLMGLWTLMTLAVVPDNPRRLGFVNAGQTAVVAATLVVSAVAGVLAYRRTTDPLSRSRLRWLGGGGVVTGLVGLAGWHLPELITGEQQLPWGALGLSGLPFVAGIAVALRRHRLFDIERLANRSVVYAAVVAVLVASYTATVTLLVTGLGLSNTVAAALAAAAAALALAPLRNAAQGVVNRLMYGDRHDPAGALDRLGKRLRAVMLPAEVLPAVVETVAQSLRVPHVAIDLADGAGGFRPAAEYGTAVGHLHTEPLLYQGDTVGRLHVSARDADDPLDPVDLDLIGTLAEQVGTAVQAVRLHDDLVRSRAEVIVLREDERRRLRRDLHDGLGPALSAIGLKAGVAARKVPADSAAREPLREIAAEVSDCVADIRRLVEALRPPALDELGLVGAVRSRADTLAGDLSIEVTGPTEPVPLPAAVETAAFRIAVEAVTNAVRHSGGRQCTVSMAVDGHGLDVSVRDDGRGLDPARTPGVGLRSMRERAAEVGGRCAVGAAPDGGTLVQAWLPLTVGGTR